MKCPNCKSNELVPTELDRGLVGAGCNSCDGTLLPLINYRYWLETIGESIDNDNVDQHVEADDSKAAKLCPKCGKMMTKYRIGYDQENRVELCGHCDEAWLDSGEWQLLKSLELQDDLSEVFTDAWQRKLRIDHEKQKWDQHFTQLFGVEDFKKISEFKSWIDQHPEAADIKHFLTVNIAKK